MEINNSVTKIPRYTNTNICCFFCNLLTYIIISICILSYYPPNYTYIWGYTIFLTLDVIFISLLMPLSKIYDNINTMLYYIIPSIGLISCFYPFIFKIHDINIYYHHYPYILLLLLFNTFINISFGFYYYYNLNSNQYKYYNAISVMI